ncbi:MAG: RNA polymerase sigma factor [Acidobacteria bacterium]|nr:RNA polymerase sigma factor [Acidobacteriota bacterium]
METLDLDTLLARCQDGDDLAWEAFVRRFQGRVYAIASGYVVDRDEARDLAQDVFVRLYEIRGRWPEAAGFVAWLCQVTKNRAIDDQRRRRVRQPLAAAAVDEGMAATDPAPGPTAVLERGRERRLLRTALARLSSLSREIVMLRDVQELSVREVAALLGVPVGTVKSRASRARVELAEEVLALGRERGRP